MILCASLDLEDGYEDEFWAWHETEHVPRVLARPGWRRMRRYECLDAGPRHFLIYDLDDGIATEPPLSEAPFRGGPYVSRGIRNYRARAWRQIHAAGDGVEPRSFLNIVTVEVDPERIEAFHRWYNEVHVPEILECPGWLANRRYERADGASEVLAIYDLEDPDRPFATPEWQQAVGWDEHVDHIRGFHGWRVYHLRFDSAERS
jgi:hypothetical protein